MGRKHSGLSLSVADIPIVLGMVARDDRDHDIAAWFGVNQGRIAEAKAGKFGTPAAAPAASLPPKGPPGVKGRHLRERVDQALKTLNSTSASGLSDAKAALAKALTEYDTDDV